MTRYALALSVLLAFTFLVIPALSGCTADTSGDASEPDRLPVDFLAKETLVEAGPDGALGFPTYRAFAEFRETAHGRMSKAAYIERHRGSLYPIQPGVDVRYLGTVDAQLDDQAGLYLVVEGEHKGAKLYLLFDQVADEAR